VNATGDAERPLGAMEGFGSNAPLIELPHTKVSIPFFVQRDRIS
jgi:hypothetical protein